MTLARVHAPLTEAQCLIISSFNNCTTFVLIVFFYLLCRMNLLWAGGQQLPLPMDNTSHLSGAIVRHLVIETSNLAVGFGN